MCAHYSMKAAEDVHTKGLEAVLEAEKKQHDIKKQWKLIKKEAALLREKEKAIAMVSYSDSTAVRVALR